MLVKADAQKDALRNILMQTALSYSRPMELCPNIEEMKVLYRPEMPDSPQAPHSISLAHAEIPEPGEYEVRIKIKWVGICDSDLEAYGGTRSPGACAGRLIFNKPRRVGFFIVNLRRIGMNQNPGAGEIQRALSPGAPVRAGRVAWVSSPGPGK